jgi:hypothetical protein
MLTQTLCRELPNCRVRKFVRVFAAATLASAFFTQVTFADGNNNSNNKNQTPGTTSWGGLCWGIGIAADFDVGGNRVTNAFIVNGLVRVNDTSGNVGVGFVLEAHYFFAEWNTGLLPPYYSCKSNNYNCNNIAIGPYVALEIGGGGSARTL